MRELFKMHNMLHTNINSFSYSFVQSNELQKIHQNACKLLKLLVLKFNCKIYSHGQILSFYDNLQ